MTTHFLSNPDIRTVCLHNTRHWQVAELMGGLACEVLKKTRDVDREEQLKAALSLHDCYPSLFMQGDDATQFLTELGQAQQKLTPQEIDRFMLDAYSDVCH